MSGGGGGAGPGRSACKLVNMRLLLHLVLPPLPPPSPPLSGGRHGDRERVRQRLRSEWGAVLVGCRDCNFAHASPNAHRTHTPPSHRPPPPPPPPSRCFNGIAVGGGTIASARTRGLSITVLLSKSKLILNPTCTTEASTGLSRTTVALAPSPFRGADLASGAALSQRTRKTRLLDCTTAVAAAAGLGSAFRCAAPSTSSEIPIAREPRRLRLSRVPCGCLRRRARRHDRNRVSPQLWRLRRVCVTLSHEGILSSISAGTSFCRYGRE